jgi:hydroxymethylpyrimidine/phosphomethylpyrimidine kinase
LKSSSSPSANPDDLPADRDQDAAHPACILVFNANDPSGATGLAADTLAIASVGAHPCPVTTGAYARDTSEIFDHFAMDDEAVTEQARSILEDMPVQIIKVGFVGNAENLSAIAEISNDYEQTPLVAYMPNLSWWDEVNIDTYQDAFRDLLLPQTTVLTGNHSTLWRWLLPDWAMDRPPSARDIARAASEFGVSYTLVTGIPLPDQYIENALATPETVLVSGKFERFEASFSGAGDTLSAALAALLGTGCDLGSATTEALGYLDQCLNSGFRPGMGNVVPDRLFWAQADDDDETPADAETKDFENPFNETRH